MSESLHNSWGKKFGRSNVPSLEQIDTLGKERLEDARKQIEVIAESLRDLAQKIEDEKPDVLVFLDVSARLLGSPYKKYLSERMGRASPRVLYYNDQDLKGLFLRNGKMDEKAQQDFRELQGKKVFFIDETFSEGKGAGAILSAAEIVGMDAQYVAITRDPDAPKSEYIIGDVEKAISRFQQKGKVIVYGNPIHNLFSRFGSRLYVEDAGGETRSLHKKVSADPSNTIPSANSYVVPPSGMSVDEYNKQVSEILGKVGREMKDVVYQTLKAGE